MQIFTVETVSRRTRGSFANVYGPVQLSGVPKAAIIAGVEIWKSVITVFPPSSSCIVTEDNSTGKEIGRHLASFCSVEDPQDPTGSYKLAMLYIAVGIWTFHRLSRCH